MKHKSKRLPGGRMRPKTRRRNNKKHVSAPPITTVITPAPITAEYGEGVADDGFTRPLTADERDILLSAFVGADLTQYLSFAEFPEESEINREAENG